MLLSHAYRECKRRFKGEDHNFSVAALFFHRFVCPSLCQDGFLSSVLDPKKIMIAQRPLLLISKVLQLTANSQHELVIYEDSFRPALPFIAANSDIFSNFIRELVDVETDWHSIESLPIKELPDPGGKTIDFLDSVQLIAQEHIEFIKKTMENEPGASKLLEDICTQEVPSLSGSFLRTSRDTSNKKGKSPSILSKSFVTVEEAKKNFFLDSSASPIVIPSSPDQSKRSSLSRSESNPEDLLKTPSTYMSSPWLLDEKQHSKESPSSLPLEKDALLESALAREISKRIALQHELQSSNEELAIVRKLLEEERASHNQTKTEFNSWKEAFPTHDKGALKTPIKLNALSLSSTFDQLQTPLLSAQQLSENKPHMRAEEISTILEKIEIDLENCDKGIYHILSTVKESGNALTIFTLARLAKEIQTAVHTPISVKMTTNIAEVISETLVAASDLPSDANTKIDNLRRVLFINLGQARDNLSSLREFASVKLNREDTDSILLLKARVSFLKQCIFQAMKAAMNSTQ
eukprot:TRINITY_DN1536_c0_g4_i5.p1 TRINITY_DN1536_c0_g4~~TRINITY_DN1536_c0_g4_i5.p1  ORF type:complete len:522 (-),score=148.30 TRINITY_DN1536_c0_g4_i5:1182-2747(-)